MTQQNLNNDLSFTEADLERWGQEADDGFQGWDFGTSVPGRPVTVGSDAKPFTFRLDAERRAKLNSIARARHTTASQLMRDLIDAL